MPPEWGGQARAASLRRGRLGGDRLGQRQELGTHRGGYDPFHVRHHRRAEDRRASRNWSSRVWDPTDAGTQPRGKQVNRPSGILYTAVTGIWQTVWLEPVPAQAIDVADDRARRRQGALRPSRSRPRAPTRTRLVDRCRTRRLARSRPRTRRRRTSRSTSPIPNAEAVDAGLAVSLRPGALASGAARRVSRSTSTSYFGMRKIVARQGRRGRHAPVLNNTAALPGRPARSGLLARRPLHRADRRGAEVRHRDHEEARLQHDPQAREGRAGPLVLLVRQARAARLAGHAEHRRCAADAHRPSRPQQFERELQRADRRPPQSSVHRHVGAVQRRLGPVRHAAHRRMGRRTTTRRGLVNSASGWTDRGVGDVHDIHAIPAPAAPKPEETRAAVLGEFGGLGLPLDRPHLAEQGQLGLPQLHDAGRTDRRVRRTCSSRLHPLDRIAGPRRPPSTRRRPTSRSK